MPLHLHTTPEDSSSAPPSPTAHVQQNDDAVQPPPSETVILLDWDDTLLCSSFLSAHHFRLDTPLYDLSRPLQESDGDQLRLSHHIAVQVRELESIVCTVLTQSISHARTVIVTAAEEGWVQLSASKLMPSVVPLLNNITIISARSNFEPIFPNSPLKWKYYAMHSVLVGSGFFGVDGRKEVEKHVISFGDSCVEREAVRALCKHMPTTRTKSVKLAERPTAEQLRRQLELISQCFGYICGHAGDLDLQLTVTVNQEPPAQEQGAETDSAPVDTNATAAPAPSTLSPPSIQPDLLADGEAKDLTPTSSSSPSKVDLPLDMQMDTKEKLQEETRQINQHMIQA